LDIRDFYERAPARASVVEKVVEVDRSTNALGDDDAFAVGICDLDASKLYGRASADRERLDPVDDDRSFEQVAHDLIADRCGQSSERWCFRVEVHSEGKAPDDDREKTDRSSSERQRSKHAPLHLRTPPRSRTRLRRAAHRRGARVRARRVRLGETEGL